LPEALRGPTFPSRAEHIWSAFIALHSGRSSSANGPNPLSWSDMKAWCDLTSTDLNEGEIRAIKALDLLWLQVMGEDETND